MLDYSTTPDALRQKLQLTPEEAEKAVAGFYEAFPMAKELHDAAKGDKADDQPADPCADNSGS